MVLDVQLVGVRSSCSSGKGKSHQGAIKSTYGFCLVKGKANHPMEDYHVAKFVQMKGHELGLFAIYDGHLGDTVPAYLQKHLFSNILKEVGYWLIRRGMLLLALSFMVFYCLPEPLIGPSINITLVYDDWTNDLVFYHVDEAIQLVVY